MSEVTKRYVEDENFGPVRLAVLEQDGAMTGVEITFEEASPVQRNKLVYFFWCMVGTAGPVVALGSMFSVKTLGDLWLYGFGGGVALAALGIFMINPPFRAPVKVILSAADKRVSITRKGRLAERVNLDHVLAVGVEAHPKLKANLEKLEMRPGNKTLHARTVALRYAESVYLHIGAYGETQRLVEVASFYGTKTGEDQAAMGVRAALALGREMALQMAGEGPIQAAAQSQELGSPGSSEAPVKRRRRRDRI